MVFPEMDAAADVPEITEACWGILGKSPESVMCATARMVVKRKGAARPAVLACTLLPYDPRFELGSTLAEASGAVRSTIPTAPNSASLAAAPAAGDATGIDLSPCDEAVLVRLSELLCQCLDAFRRFSAIAL